VSNESNDILSLLGTLSASPLVMPEGMEERAREENEYYYTHLQNGA
jgi:hypothetical protein